MINNLEILGQFGRTVVADIIDRHIAANQRASGSFVQGLRYEASDRRLLVIDGVGYSYFLEEGRGPTKGGAKGDERLSTRILEWMGHKGISGKPYKRKDGTMQDQKKADESMAYLIARNIHLHGTRLYQRGGESGVISGAITEERISALVGAFSGEYASQTLSDLVPAFK